MIIIEPSILSADFARLGEQAEEAESAGADRLQIDVMDGHFVPNITFGPGVVSALRKVVGIPLNAHLMILEPDRYLKTFADAGANSITIHQEAAPHLHRSLQAIKKMKLEAGVAINPATPLSSIEEVIEDADFIQLMTVNPGFGGQKFIISQLAKIRRLKEIIRDQRLKRPIAVDGGIDQKTAPRAVKAGANILVAGSSIYNHRASVAANIKALRTSVRKLS